jgi:hypothetical protein
LRAQELPSEDEFAAARARASALFGVNVPEYLVARNVNRLASDVREKVTGLEPAVNNLRRTLETRADRLGVPTTAVRITIARYAANLLARLSAARDALTTVRELADAGQDDVKVQVLGNAIATAPQVLDALDRVEWDLLESVRRFVGRGDAVDAQAQRLLADITDTAADDEFTRSLPPVLSGVRRRAVALIEEAARLAAVAPPHPTPPPPPAREEASSDSAPSPSAENPKPVGGQAKPAERRITTSVVEQRLQAILDDFSTEIRDYAKDHPGVEIVLDWRIVHEDRS